MKILAKNKDEIVENSASTSNRTAEELKDNQKYLIGKDVQRLTMVLEQEKPLRRVETLEIEKNERMTTETVKEFKRGVSLQLETIRNTLKPELLLESNCKTKINDNILDDAGIQKMKNAEI